MISPKVIFNKHTSQSEEKAFEMIGNEVEMISLNINEDKIPSDVRNGITSTQTLFGRHKVLKRKQQIF